jgi:hypothetical protein
VAFDEFRRRQVFFEEKGLAFADTHNMHNPPQGTKRYVVMRLVEIRE